MNVVEDHNKADGLDLRQPQGAQAVGLVWPGGQGIQQTGLVEGHSRQAVLIPFYSGVQQVFAVFVLKGLTLMMDTLVLDVIGNHLLVTQGVGESPILFPPTPELRKGVGILFHPLAC